MAEGAAWTTERHWALLEAGREAALATVTVRPEGGWGVLYSDTTFEYAALGRAKDALADLEAGTGPTAAAGDAAYYAAWNAMVALPATAPVRDRPRMPIEEFQGSGLLHEVNRQLLHPLGLALEVLVDHQGRMSLGGVWDNRDDPEGMRFDPDTLSADKAAAVEEMWEARLAVRVAALGYMVQPVVGDRDPTLDRRLLALAATAWLWEHDLPEGELPDGHAVAMDAEIDVDELAKALEAI